VFFLAFPAFGCFTESGDELVHGSSLTVISLCSSNVLPFPALWCLFLPFHAFSAFSAFVCFTESRDEHVTSANIGGDPIDRFPKKQTNPTTKPFSDKYSHRLDSWDHPNESTKKQEKQEKAEKSGEEQERAEKGKTRKKPAA
jgi:hypothetical protein